MVAEVNWSAIRNAIWFYKMKGYTYLEVPWIVPDGPYNATRPPDAPAFATRGGNLVASGEQSFMQMMEEGKELGKSVCCTPCFRVEPNPDELHLPYFMKVELIHQHGGPKILEEMVQDALEFFQKIYSHCRVVDMPDGSFDIVGQHSGIELGSYGMRYWRGHHWVYGTGLAEPRASQVRKIEKELICKAGSEVPT